MSIDASIYNNIKQFETPSYADAQAKAMSMSQMAMQNQHMSSQMKSDEENQKLEYAKKYKQWHYLKWNTWQDYQKKKERSSILL